MTCSTESHSRPPDGLGQAGIGQSIVGLKERCVEQRKLCLRGGSEHTTWRRLGKAVTEKSGSQISPRSARFKFKVQCGDWKGCTGTRIHRLASTNIEFHRIRVIITITLVILHSRGPSSSCPLPSSQIDSGRSQSAGTRQTYHHPFFTPAPSSNPHHPSWIASIE